MKPARWSCCVSPRKDRHSAAGIEAGDVIVSAGGDPVQGLADYYRTLWKGRESGDHVSLTVERDGEQRSVDVIGGDRYDWLRLGTR